MTSVQALFQLPQVNKLTNSNSKLNVNTKFNGYELSASTTNTTKNAAYALHQSILDGRIKQVYYFLKMGIKVNTKDKFGRSCLMIAALSDHEEYGLQVTKLLLKYGADLNMKDSLGRTVLYIACSEKREKLFDYIITNNYGGIDFRSRDNDGNILLNHVAAYGSLNMVRKVILKMKEKQIELDQRNNNGYTALLLAIQNDQFFNAYELLKEEQTSTSVQDTEKFYNALEWLIYRTTVNKELNLNDNQPQNKKITSVRNSISSSHSLINMLDSNLSINSSKYSYNMRKNPSINNISNNSMNSSTMKFNYKTWYKAIHPYFPVENCEHSANTNYSTDHHKSRYIPLILTPRNFPSQDGLNLNKHQNQSDEELFKEKNHLTKVKVLRK